jgi:SWI/SNF-related matrix-associated actin-dependent regulator 1 of chromatin subfamily A
VLSPYPHQIDGALFLTGRKSALLADEPRVGKTGTAIMAADLNIDATILVVTTASGRAVWKRAFGDWSTFGRTICVLPGAQLTNGPLVAIVSWAGITEPRTRALLLSRKWDRIILDESHYAKSIETKRTQAVYGQFLDDGRVVDAATALVRKSDERVWPLTGTPMPNAPNDLYPMLRSLRPECLRADAEKDWPDVTKYGDFLHRYCVVRMKKISNFRRIPVVVGGRNLPELRARIGDFWLRRTQQDVGIREPVYEVLPLSVSSAMLKAAEKDADRTEILTAAQNGDTKKLEMHLGPLRRITGEIKAKAVVDAVKEEFDCGLDKIVLAYWHKDVGQMLLDGLKAHGVVGIDGSTSASSRAAAEKQFRTDPETRVFLGQIAAAGEAIDLSVAANLWFVETAFQPAQMKQMSLRITNTEQKRQAIVRVCALEGSIDEALQAILMRKWAAIREVLTQ